MHPALMFWRCAPRARADLSPPQFLAGPRFRRPLPGGLTEEMDDDAFGGGSFGVAPAAALPDPQTGPGPTARSPNSPASSTS